MTDYIINSFILQDKNTLIDIYNYIKLRYENPVEIHDIKTKLAHFKKHNIIFFNNINFELTQEGNVILNDHKYYYSNIIIRFYKKYNKNHRKYELKEIRKEQQQLRHYLITHKPHVCVICDKTLPLCLLETAHLKPRCILNYNEKTDKNIVEFMCRYCHTLYDNGLLSVYNGLLYVSSVINNYDLHYNEHKQITYYNSYNTKYFHFHYNYIYNRRVYSINIDFN
jgi:hypothetical protein